MQGLLLGALLLTFVPGSLRGPQVRQAEPAGLQSGPAASRLAARARAVWGSERFELRDLTLPGGRPATFQLDLQHGGAPVSFVLRRHSVRARGAVLRVQTAEGVWREEALPPVATYRGSIAGDPASTVLASLGADGLTADVVASGEIAWSIRPLAVVDERAPAGSHAIIDDIQARWPAAPCGVVEQRAARPPLARARAPQPLADCLKLCEIAFDADFEYFQAQGSSVTATVTAIDAIMNQVDYYYARDVLITYRTTGYVVRTAPFYAPTSGGDLLDLFEAEWTANQTAIPRDLTHLMTGKPVSVIQHGGLAQLDVVCNPGYAWSMDGANIVGHEIGHNWGAPHCLDPTPCNNMCGACLNIAPITKGIIAATRDAALCLDGAGPYATAVPPYAHPERVTLRKEELDSLGSLTFDVLANDHDANCEPLLLTSYDPVGSRGGSVSLSPGTGPQGRDELVYVPSQVFVGQETFHYYVGDGLLSTEGTVTIDVPAVKLVANWRMDEGAGTTVGDQTLGGRTGALVGDPAWVPGPFGTALDFDGIDDAVVTPALDLGDDSITLTTWFLRDGLQSNLAGLVFSRDGTTGAGLQLLASGSVGATWNRLAWNPFLPSPSQQWVFAAMVIEPDRETLHLYDGALTTVSQAVTNGEEAFDGELRFAHDDYFIGNRHFDGALDEVRVYDYALDASEVLELAVSGGRAAAPAPSDGGAATSPNELLQWVGSPLAVSYGVYFGSDYRAVRDATTGSPEYLGASFGTSFAGPPLAGGVEYFWRVDQDLGGPLLPGRVWQFRLAAYHHWPLDETSGSVALAAQGGIDGVYVGCTLGEPGAGPPLGTSVAFDGVADRVEIPALDLDSNQVTLTCWVRRDGVQKFLAGVLAARDAETISGLHVDGGDELRYHWNDSSATWNFSSGLVLPDREWAFVALVVEPNRGTLYLGHNGALASAANSAVHDAEPFGDLLYLAHDPVTGSTRRRFKGNLDDVRVYRASLTRPQVEALYQAGR